MYKTKYIKNFNEFLFEAFQQKDMLSAISKIINYLSKKLGQLYRLPGIEDVRKENDNNYFGIHYVHESGKGIRFNWKVYNKNSEIHSVDFFDNNQEQATKTIEVDGSNINHILDDIVNIFKGNSNEALVERDSNIEDDEEEEIENINVKVKPAETENTIVQGYSKAKDKLDDTEYADPDTVFEDLKGFVECKVKCEG